MAELNFPSDPVTNPTYTAAGVTWNWNSTLNVWSTNEPPTVLTDSSGTVRVQATATGITVTGVVTSTGNITAFD